MRIFRFSDPGVLHVMPRGKSEFMVNGRLLLERVFEAMPREEVIRLNTVDTNARKVTGAGFVPAWRGPMNLHPDKLAPELPWVEEWHYSVSVECDPRTRSLIVSEVVFEKINSTQNALYVPLSSPSDHLPVYEAVFEGQHRLVVSFMNSAFQAAGDQSQVSQLMWSSAECCLQPPNGNEPKFIPQKPINMQFNGSIGVQTADVYPCGWFKNKDASSSVRLVVFPASI